MGAAKAFLLPLSKRIATEDCQSYVPPCLVDSRTEGRFREIISANIITRFVARLGLFPALVD